MAGKITREKLQVDVVINGNEAQAELYKLEKRQRELNASNKDLRAEKAKLIAQGKKESEAYRNVTAQIKQNNAELKSNKLEMSNLQKQIGITGLSMRQLRQRASELKVALNNMVPGSGKYKQLQAELKEVNTQISKLSLNAKASKSSLSKVADGFNKYAALGASVIAMGTGVVLSMQKMIDYNGKLSDSQADVRKTTGLTTKEVDELTKSFGMLKTRTARIELLKLAEEGGRLGIEGVKNIKDFVEVSNQLKVALGDDLGDEQIREVGKMVNVYKVGEKTGRDFKNSMLSLGSAINEVSASGANQAGYLVDYLKRQAGIAVQAKVSAEDNLAYAATFDEIGQSVEISATAMNKVWMDMFTNTGEYAKIAGMDLKSFTNLLNTDANGAMIKFLKGLNGNNEGLAVMLDKLKDLEAGGARGVQALSALAGNTELLEERQKQSNKALIEATSLTDEYNLKNNNLAGSIDKIKKSILGAFTSEVVVTALTDFVEWFAKFIGATEDADGKITRFRNRLIAFLKTLIIITTAILSYKAAIQLAAIWTKTLNKTSQLYIITQKIQAATTSVLRSATLLLSAGYNLVTGNIVRARAAMVLLNRTMMLNPIGLVVAALSAAAMAYAVFSENSKKAATSQSLLNSALKEAAKNTAETIKSKELLLDIARDETQSLEKRQEAIDELNRTVPEYNNQLTIEAANTESAKIALDKHIESLKNAAIAHVLLERIKAKAVELADLENSSVEENINWYDKLWAAVKTGGQVTSMALASAEAGLKNKYDNINATKEEIALLEELYKNQIKEPGSPERNDLGEPIPTTPTGKPVKTKGNPAKEAKRRAANLLKIQRDAEDAKLDIMADGFDKQMLLEDFNHYRKIEDLQNKLVSQETIAKTTDANMKASYLENNKAINSQIESELELHEIRKGTILEKGYANDIKQSQEAYNREKVIRETAFLEELNSITTLSEAKSLLAETLSGKELSELKTLDNAKKALQEQFNASELQKQKEHLDKLVAQLQEFMSSGQFEGFDMSLLTPEQQAEFEAQVDALKLKIQELIAAKKGLSGEGSDEGEGEIDLGAAGEMDVLGFTADQWLETFSNLDSLAGKIQAGIMGVQAFANAWSMYHEMVSANERKELATFERNNNRKKERLKSRLDQGFINQRQYDDAIKALEIEADKRKAEMEYKQAKRAWQIQLTQAIANTAMAVLNGLQATPFLPVGIAMGALAGILGGIQIATIAKNKPVKGYEKGKYPVTRQQDGKQFNATYGGESRSGIVDEPTVFLAGEAGKNSPELIINGEDLKQFHPDLKNSLYREIGRVRGYEDGYYQSRTTEPEFNNSSTSSQESASLAMLANVIERNSDILEKLEANGVAAYLDKNLRNIKKLRDEFDRLNKIENKRKHN